VDALAVAVLVERVGGCAADWGCDADADVGGEFVCAALAVAGGVLMPFVSGAGEAMVVCGCGWFQW
jgi:hypothetical protein